MKIFLLGLTLLLLGTAAHAKVEEEAAAESTAKVTGVTVKTTNDAKIKESIKPKRDASHSIGGSAGGGGYHGPSYKYLPPTTSVVVGYDGYRGSSSGGGGGSRHHAHGNALSSVSGYDFGSLADGYHYRHHGSSGGGISGATGGIYHAPTKVETYIVQTEHGSGIAGGAHSSSAGGGHHYAPGQHGYKYVSAGSGSYASNGAGSLSLSHHGLGGGGASASSSLGLGQHKPFSVYALPAPTPVHYQPATQHSGYASYLHKPSSSSAAGSLGLGATHGHGHGFELGLEHVGSHSHASEHASGSAAGAGLGYHYAPTSTPVVEHVEESLPAHGYYSSGSGSDVGHQTFFGSHQGASSSGSESATSGGGGSGFGGTSLIAGYNYAVPTLPFAIVRKPTTTNSYGTPTSTIATAPSVYEEHQPPQEQHNSHGLAHAHGHGQGADDVTPVYALGHKGLGHFSYTSSKPQALHTDIVASTTGSTGHASVSTAANGYGHGDLSKAPFRPSVFLGAKHESSSTSSGATGSAVAGVDDVYYSSPTAQYLPPTSGGYEYQAPTLIYGAPTHAGDSAAPIYEPESTYLPPAHH